MTPSARTLARCRKLNLGRAEVVEKWIIGPGGKALKRKDLFGIIDILVIDKCGTLGIQATSGSNHSARVKKARETPELQDWLACDTRAFAVVSWRKNAKGRWQGRATRFQPTPTGYTTVEVPF